LSVADPELVDEVDPVDGDDDPEFPELKVPEADVPELGAVELLPVADSAAAL
jgi:hypothetical protein